jgi:F-type H+-transporting ATPase subunit epsilon
VIAVHQGFVEVSLPDSAGETRVTILSDVCELADSIDVERARAAKERAEEALRADADDPEAGSALLRAEVRLSVAEVA